ncbi:DUF1254 domain-containing protein [Monashia sp. NPDC004114]
MNDQFDARSIGIELYTYLYPLVTMEVTRRQMTNAPLGSVTGRGPMNTFVHVRQFPPADFRDVVRPNFDTLYSVAWLDLSTEPLVVSVPDTDGRYYVLPMYDMWTDAFAAPGWRTTGTSATSWALLAPGWDGRLPDGVRPIHCPTSTVWVIGRTQTNGPDDYAAVNTVQDGLTITPLSVWPGAPAPVSAIVDPEVDNETEPLRQVNAMSVVEYLTLGADLLLTHPPHATDFAVIERARQIGFHAGQPFDAAALGADIVDQLEHVPADAVAHMQAVVPTMARLANGWSMNTDSMGVYGNFYLKRAVIAMVGLGANQAEDAIYPLQVATSDGAHADGENAYTLHFPADQLPPCDAFWSVTMYDEEGFQVANPIDRFAIGSKNDLRHDADGSLTLLVQHSDPGGEDSANWLPAPAGRFSLCMRLYAPRPQALDGRWNPPPLVQT